MSLDKYTDDALRAELKRREDERRTPPKSLDVINYANVTMFVKDNINHLYERGHLRKDIEHSLFELVMEAVYGPNIWAWWNRNYNP